MKQNQSFFRRAADFAQDRGFYIILGLCAVAIGISGYVLFFTGNDTNDIPEPQTTVSAPNEIEVPDPGPDLPLVWPEKRAVNHRERRPMKNKIT